MFQLVIDCFGISTSTVLVKTYSQVLASAATTCEVSIGLFLALACLAIRVRDGRIRHASRRAEGKSHHGMFALNLKLGMSVEAGPAIQLPAQLARMLVAILGAICG